MLNKATNPFPIRGCTSLTGRGRNGWVPTAISIAVAVAITVAIPTATEPLNNTLDFTG